jgi:mannose-6-phosphate isomerase-like protein (cupin superfamily)
MSNFRLIEIFSVSDERGMLTVMQNALPFEAARTFWITGADKEVRGGHRHYKNRQALIALSGEVSVYMNDGTHAETIELKSPNSCLIVEPEDWHTMTFGEGAVLLVFASHSYDRADYIDEPYKEQVSQ